MYYVELMINGLLVGILYSLIALGFVLIYKASDVINFAQGELVMFAGTSWRRACNFTDSRSPWPSCSVFPR